MSNFIQWNGIAEDGTANDITWGNADYTWGDFQIITEVADIAGKGTYARKERQKKLDEYLEKDKEKKKRLIHLICRVGGEKVYDETKEINDDVEVTIDDVEMLVERVVKTIKVEKVNVL